MVDFVRDRDTGLEVELDVAPPDVIEQPQFFMPQPVRASSAHAEEFRADLPDAARDRQP